MEKYNKIKKIEGLIKPDEIAKMAFLQAGISKIPTKSQIRMIKNSSKQYPYMAFIVQPYSSFLAHEILDLSWAKSLIPENFELAKTKIFESDKQAKYYAIFSCFNVKSSAFNANRIEFNIICKNKKTGLISWVIVEHESDSISYNPIAGFVKANTIKCINTTNYDGVLIVESLNENKRHLSFDFSLETYVDEQLDQALWFDGNLSVAYQTKLNQAYQPFSLIFDEKEVISARKIHSKDIRMHHNTWFEGKISFQPDKIVYFPYAQHFLSMSPESDTSLNSRKQMNQLYQTLDFDTLKSYDTKKIISKIKWAWIITSIGVYGLLIYLIFIR